MKTKLHLIIMSLVLLFVAGGQSVCLAAESWSYPTTKPETPFGGGDGSKWNPYRIESAQHLANLAYMVTDNNTEYKNKYFILTNDITLNDDVINADGTGLKNSESSYKLWTPIGEYGFTADDDFMGTFDGQGHTIRGMVCIDTTGKRDYNGLFGTTDQATIMNLNLEDCYVGASSVLINDHKSGVLSGSATKSSDSWQGYHSERRGTGERSTRGYHPRWCSMPALCACKFRAVRRRDRHIDEKRHSKRTCNEC